MKLRYFIMSLVALLAVAVGCTKDELVGSLDNIEVSNTYIVFPAEGGVQTITLVASESWAFDTDYIPDWLTVSPLYGDKGEYTITFTASAMDDADSAELEILVGSNTQFINVSIGEAGEAEPVEILEVINNGISGKTYIVSGWCSSIANTTYGNWYIADDDGNRLYIYGTMTNGKYDWDSEGIDVGDYVTVKGPLAYYNGTPELVDVVVLSVEKNLISVKTPAETIAKEGGEATVILEVSGEGLSFSIPEEDKSWLSVSDIVDAADSVTVVFYAQPNDGGDRSSSVTFSTVSNGTTYSTEAEINQEGSVVEATAAEIIAGADGTRYTMGGYIREVASTTYGNFYLKDYTGEVYVYGTLDAEGNTKNWESLGINEGDIVKVTGPKTTYNTTVELVDVTVEEHYPVTDVTVSEFNAASVASDVYYRMTGTVTSIASTSYGNLYLEDETGSVYVYGLPCGYGGPDSSFSEAGIEEGDIITIVGTRGEYNGTIEVMYGFYVETVGQGEVTKPGDGTVDNPYSASEALEIINNGTYTSDKVYVKGIISQIDEVDTGSYGNATYYISDDGTTENQFEIYRGYSLGGAKFTSSDEIKVGDEVVVYGVLTMYYDTPEMTTGSSIYSLNGETASEVNVGPVEGNGTVDSPYSVGAALQIINNGTYTSSSVYVKGVITQIDEISTSYGNATYYISYDASGNYASLEVYRGYSLGGAKFTSSDEIKVGDEVIVYGELTMYYSTPEITTGSSIYSLNGQLYEEGEQGSDDSFATNLGNWTLVASASNDEVIIDGETYNLLKLGTSSKVGSATNTLPAGTTKVQFYCIAWNNGGPAPFTVTIGTTSYSDEATAHSGLANDSPYTINDITDSDYFEITLDAALTADTTVTVETTSSSKPRVGFIGFKYVQ